MKCFPLRLSPRSNVVDPQCCTGMCHLEGHTCPWVDRICNDKPVPAPKPSAWAWFKNRLATLRDDLVSFLEQPCPWE